MSSVNETVNITYHSSIWCMCAAAYEYGDITKHRLSDVSLLLSKRYVSVYHSSVPNILHGKYCIPDKSIRYTAVALSRQNVTKLYIINYVFSLRALETGAVICERSLVPLERNILETQRFVCD